MNERIEELALQAGLYVNLEGRPWPRSMSAEESNEAYSKFAELIVKECVSVVSKRKNQAIDDEWNVDEAMTTAEIDLEEHFGVENE